MNKVRSFTAPVDRETAARLVQQLAKFEDNTEMEAGDIRSGFQPIHRVVSRESGPTAAPIVAPGEAIGCATAGGDCSVTLAKPTAKNAGKSVIIYKRDAANAVNLAAQDSTVTGVAVYTLTNAGRYEAFCDGVEYWI